LYDKLCTSWKEHIKPKGSTDDNIIPTNIAANLLTHFAVGTNCFPAYRTLTRIPPFLAEAQLVYCESIYAKQCPVSGFFPEKDAQKYISVHYSTRI
jgi:hypothetical protein